MDPALIIAIGVFLFLSFTTTVLILFACGLSGRISRLEDDELHNVPIEEVPHSAYDPTGRIARRTA